MSIADVALSPIREESVRSPGYLDSRSGLYSNESIVIYLTVAGSVVPMRVLESDSITSVKLRIQTCERFVAKKQKLVLGGRELSRNDSLIKDYGVTKGNVLHLVLRLSDRLVITVRTTCEKKFEFHVNRKYRVNQAANRQKRESSVVAKAVEKDVELSVVAANWDERTDGLHEGDNLSEELCVSSCSKQVRDFLLEPVFVNPIIKLPSTISDMIKSTLDGLERGKRPIRSSDGCE
ncbi:phosphoinositide 4-kinase gamma 4 [Actinidia rufa]|uniref:Phosphoinositide 4-kinase gamma 4 n=1 Tax=Actinidia rufa TaxID=165716 RepID=A0A7J0DJP3_9ERIC|nr:phosphoinositide 4-kinase gamma 4 [Actinidia rufa]